jgi:hypothetical protein
VNSFLVAFSVLGAAWLAFCIWTIRRLLLRGDGVTRRSVLGWAVPMWLALAGSQWVSAADRSISAPGELFAPGALLSLAGALVFGVPFALWIGYAMHGMFAHRPARRSGAGEE